MHFFLKLRHTDDLLFVPLSSSNYYFNSNWRQKMLFQLQFPNIGSTNRKLGQRISKITPDFTKLNSTLNRMLSSVIILSNPTLSCYDLELITALKNHSRACISKTECLLNIYISYLSIILYSYGTGKQHHRTGEWRLY